MRGPQWPHIARYCDTIAAMPHTARYFFREVSTPPKWCETPPWYLVSHRHICAIPHFATYRAIIVRYPTKTSTKKFCDTVAASIARYEKYRCWASKEGAFRKPTKLGASIGTLMPYPPNLDPTRTSPEFIESELSAMGPVQFRWPRGVAEKWFTKPGSWEHFVSFS